MNLKLKHFFIIFLILLFAIQVQADAPINYNKELASDVELRGTFFTNDNADGFYVSLIGVNSIQINSDMHYIDKTIKIKKTALDSRFKKFDGINIGITHISDDGIVNNYISPVVVDGEFVYITVDFSTIIINGMTGTTTTTLTGLSGNQSISVPYGSSYDLNITHNQEGVWTINGTNFTKRLLWTLNTTSENLTNYQVGRVTPYDSDMQADMNDRLLTYYGNDTLISFWDEEVINSVNATGYVKVPKTSTIEQQQYWLYYGNSSADNASSIYDTMIFADDFEDGDVSDWPGGITTFQADSSIVKHGSHSLKTYSTSWQYGYKSFTAIDYPIVLDFWIYPTSNTHTRQFGLGAAAVPDRTNSLYAFAANNGYFVSSDGTTTTNWCTYNANQWYHIRLVAYPSTDTFDAYVDDMDTPKQAGLSIWGTFGGDIRSFYVRNEAATQYFDTIFIHKHTATEPTWAADGEEQTASGTLNITASITGDSNEQSYNVSQTRDFTLTPTGTTNDVFINTTSGNYNVTVTTYWTENTTLQTETATVGYAKQYINYTPSFNVTSADLNTTFTFNFSAQDYIGTATSTLNDVSKTTTRDGQDVNASVGSLTEATPYWWNVTVPYNNIFTLSNQSDTTSFLGVSKQFNDSIYNDPDNNPIFSRLWNFGDNSNISTSNPTHTYTSLGVFNANYTVTENATTDNQTITKEFNVSVEVQPPQNVTTVPHQTNVSINWDNYTYADKYSVYELEDGFPYVATNPTVDGVKDAIYDCAHVFLIFTPNYINPRDYDTIYPIRTSLGAYFFIETIDNDAKLGDDDTQYYFDLDNNGLTVNDSSWRITNNQVQKTVWDGSSWQVTGSSNAVGASTGGGTLYPKHELFIPVAELGANWTNESIIKVLVRREDSDLSPNVETWFPYGNINDTDTSLWHEIKLNQVDDWVFLANTTQSNYTALNLTPFTWYFGGITSWNGTTESELSTFEVITDPIHTYLVTGYILNSLGDGIAGATVWAQNGFVCEATLTDIYGYYEGCNLLLGNYSIYGNASGYAENHIDIYVSGNMTNQNITLTAFEMTDWMLWEKLLEIEDAIDDLSTDFTPTEGNYEMLSSTYNIFLLLLGACFILAFPKRGEVTERDTGLNNVLFSFLGTILSVFLAQIIVSGQVVESFAFESQIYDPLQHYFLYLIAVIMFVVFVLNVVYYIRQRVD